MSDSEELVVGALHRVKGHSAGGTEHF